MVCNAEDEVIVNCSITPEIYSSVTPKHFNTSNNLRRKTGSGFFSAGRVMIINGRLLDAACTPISSATINIWQTDSYGKYLHEAHMMEDSDDNNYDQYFSGTGSATTDNLGYFSFITVFPGSHENRAPHIKFMVQHRDFIDFQTEMFFSDYEENDKDPVLQKVESSLRPLLMAQLASIYRDSSMYVYKFNITLNSYNPYKE
jgi:protocatechuate 3,4-dioxygenase beta subunit